MSVTTRNIIDDSVNHHGQRSISVDYILHTGEIIRKKLKLDVVDDANTVVIANDNLAITTAGFNEVNYAVKQSTMGEITKMAIHQDQADFDRRVLGRMMIDENAHNLGNAYSFFQAVESRGGANANARATYLGISTDEYNEIDDRFSNVNGVTWFLNDEKDMVWDSLPGEYR